MELRRRVTLNQPLSHQRLLGLIQQIGFSLNDIPGEHQLMRDMVTDKFVLNLALDNTEVHQG